MHPGAMAAWCLAASRLVCELLTVQDEAEQRRCVEQAASELRQILAGKRLPRGGVYVPGQQPGMGPPQVDAFGPPAAGPVIGVACARFALSTILRMFADCTREILSRSTACRASSSQGFRACPEEPRPITPTLHPRQVSCPLGRLRALMGSRRPTGKPSRRLCPACRAPACPWALRPRRNLTWSSA